MEVLWAQQCGAIELNSRAEREQRNTITTVQTSSVGRQSHQTGREKTTERDHTQSVKE